MAFTKGLFRPNVLGTGKDIFKNEAIIAVLASSLLSPILVPKITELVNRLPPMISSHASIAAAIPAILLFRIAAGVKSPILRAAIIGVSGSFVLTAIMPIVSPLIARVRS
tara:strand:+ start:103 stop:432 length:330 start_codon:yes stop_codon:yes gene_type:complete